VKGEGVLIRRGQIIARPSSVVLRSWARPKRFVAPGTGATGREAFRKNYQGTIARAGDLAVGGEPVLRPGIPRLDQDRKHGDRGRPQRFNDGRRGTARSPAVVRLAG